MRWRGPASEDSGEDFRGAEQRNSKTLQPGPEPQNGLGEILHQAWQCRKEGEGQDWGKGAPASHCNENVATLAWEGRVVKARGGSGELTRKGFNQNWSRSPGWNTGEEARGDQGIGRSSRGGGSLVGDQELREDEIQEEVGQGQGEGQSILSHP